MKQRNPESYLNRCEVIQNGFIKWFLRLLNGRSPFPFPVSPCKAFSLRLSLTCVLSWTLRHSSAAITTAPVGLARFPPRASQGLQLVLEHPLPHQVPQQHAEHGVGGQAQEDGPDALVEPQQPLRLAHLHHAVQEAPVQLALLRDWTHTRRGEGWKLPCGATVRL